MWGPVGVDVPKVQLLSVIRKIKENGDGWMRMKKILHTFLLVLCTCTFLSACSNRNRNENDYFFRAGKWGDSRETVKALDEEIDPIFRNEAWQDDLLLGSTVLNGYNARFSYAFEDNKLVKGLYTLEPDFTSGIQYIGLYEMLEKSLTDEYGTPSLSEIHPIKKDLADDAISRSDTLEHGYVVYNTIFETNVSDILLAMRCEDGSIQIDIFYTHMDYYDGKNGTDAS